MGLVATLGLATLTAVSLAACGDADETTALPAPTTSQGGAGGQGADGGDGGSGGQVPGEPIEFLSFETNWGDVGLRFALSPPDTSPRDVQVEYQGCSATSWTEAILVDSAAALGLAAGEHVVKWASWEQEAGCVGEIRVRLTTQVAEQDESEPLDLQNGGSQSGFLEYPQGEQGVDDTELDVYAAALEALLGEPSVDFVATRRGDQYEVHAARGSVIFRRNPTNTGWQYEIVEVTGTHPIGEQDPTLFPTLAEELARGANPNGVSYPSLGYDEGDERLSFIEPADDSYPYGYERIAAYFDHPDSADLMVNWVGYAGYHMAPGEHGSLNMQQSRSPLVLWGKGIEPGEKTVLSRQVDVAPTVARLLGMPFIDGVDERGIYSHFVHLAWQDGHVLEEVLDGQTSDRVIILVSDGLTHTELLDKIERDPSDVPALARLKNEGAWLRYGSITNWPSVTYPSHNVIGSGVYSGHHGLVDNAYYLRQSDSVADPIGELFNTAEYFNPVLTEAETLHVAVHRAFGDWVLDNAHGAYTLSVLDPSVVGANTADLELHDDSGDVSFPLDTLLPPWDTPFPNVQVWEDYEVWAEQTALRTGMAEFHKIFTSSAIPYPTYVIMNTMTTDAAGHNVGAHGDLLNPVLENVDANVAKLMEWLGSWGLLETTTIILTSDHGMQLGDESRSSPFRDALDDASIATVDGTSSMGVYFE